MAKRDFLVNIDLNKNELLNAKLQNLGTLPILTTGDTGYFGWYNNTANFWTGTGWKSLEETIATNLNQTLNSTTINLTPVTGGLSGLTTTISGATSTYAGLMTSSMYDRLNNSVVKSDYTAFSILGANSDGLPLPLSASTYSVFGRLDNNLQEIKITTNITGTYVLNNSIPSTKSIKDYVDNIASSTGHTHFNLYQPNGLNSFVYTDNSGTLHIDGDIVQSGSTYDTHAENVYTTNNQIILRDGAIAGLSNGEFAGLTAKLYDGVNDGQLVIDNNGVARVGDVGFTQAIATRIDLPTDGYIAYWENANSRLNFKQLSISDISNINTISTVGTITGGTWQGTIIAPAYGGTGINNGNRTLTISENSGTIDFDISGVTLTVLNNASVSGDNTGDVTLGLDSGLSLAGQILNLGTPSYITATSINNVVGNSHTHAISGLTSNNLAVVAGITNAQLANSSIVIGSTGVSLGSIILNISGLTSIAATTFTGALVGNATTASTLQTPRNISLSGDVSSTGTTFNGGSNIVIPVTLPDILTGGTFTKVIVNNKGQVTSGTNPITLDGYGITDAYKKFATIITGNGVATSFAITHGLNNFDILTSVRDGALNSKVEVEEIITDANTLTINFNVPPSNGKVFRVVIGG